MPPVPGPLPSVLQNSALRIRTNSILRSQQRPEQVCSLACAAHALETVAWGTMKQHGSSTLPAWTVWLTKEIILSFPLGWHGCTTSFAALYFAPLRYICCYIFYALRRWVARRPWPSALAAALPSPYRRLGTLWTKLCRRPGRTKRGGRCVYVGGETSRHVCVRSAWSGAIF